MTDIISFQAGREARIANKPRDGRRNADWLHGWDIVDREAPRPCDDCDYTTTDSDWVRDASEAMLKGPNNG
jgi:hypothetical protein